jgi:glycosyltransferase involved in cell wall biosynthesis
MLINSNSRVRARIAKLCGSGRPRVIAVFGASRRDVERSVKHAESAASALPVWVWCEEEAGPVDGCARFFCGAEARRPIAELRGVRPALAIVAWTASGGAAKLKLLPFFLPPFRVLVQNEIGDFFPARPKLVASHVTRRLRDTFLAAGRRAADWVCASPLLLRQAGNYSRTMLHRLEGHLHDANVRAGEILDTAWIHSRGYLHDVRIRSNEISVDASHLFREVCHLGYESCMDVLACLAQGTPVMAIALVRRQSGSRHLTVCMGQARPDFVEICLRDRGWPRREIIRALLNTNAGFIVFRRLGEEADARGLVALARERNAFAAAKQAAFSHWRQRVVTKHPFRKLQPGEVTNVFAPWSTLLVVRRDALLQLGCPRAFTAGAALMLLFWKAASAGLASFVAGDGNDVSDEPAMVLEDAEFSLRLALSPALRSLGSLHPARQRGNIASMPARARRLSGRRRVLVVSPYLPWPLSHGGAVRIYNLCRALAHEVDFILACFRENGETVHYDKLYKVFREVYIVDTDEKRPASQGVPAQVAEYRNRAMEELIRSLCLERGVDLVQLEYTQMAGYRDQTETIPTLLVEHDITSTLHRQLAEMSGDAGARWEYERWLTFEREALQESNAVWTMSHQDREIAVNFGAAPAAVSVVPNGVDLVRFRPETKSGSQRTVLFVGSFRHLPNLMAFEVLREQIMPEIWREFPDTLLHVIAGPNYTRAAAIVEKSRLLEPNPRIRVKDFVEDLRPAYRGADVVVIPLPVSAGTNIKLMEAMACGKAIVSTPVGCQGLDLTHGRDLLVADLTTEFASAVNLLLRDPGLRRRLAAEARATAERRFGWDAIAKGASQSYSRLLGRAVMAAVNR